MTKPALTISILAKESVKALTMVCLRQLAQDQTVGSKLTIIEDWALNQSDLPKFRSQRLSAWYDNPNTKPQDLFMFIDADQTFLPSDVLKAYEIMQATNADVVCGAYARNNLTPTVECVDKHKFYSERQCEIQYGATGFMMMSYPIVDKVAKKIGQIIYKNGMLCYPFFYELIIDRDEHIDSPVWLGEDYSFCYQVRQNGGKLIGFLSDTIGHLITKDCHIEVPRMQEWKEKTIAIMASSTPEPWSPKSVERGVGGSELAIIELAKRWKGYGYTPIVYCNCGSDAGFYDGIIYQNWEKFQSMDKFNILIIWRNEKLLQRFKYSAKKLIFDMHDFNPVDTSKYIREVDYFCVKSKFHATSCLPDVPKEKIAIIPNGGQVEPPVGVTRNMNRLIYASSYDRGLQEILLWGWPMVRQFCPQAELHIYYGWDVFDKMTSIETDPDVVSNREEWKMKMQQLFAQPGVFEHGRVTQAELLVEKAKSNIHYYTGKFQEIDCISVRESACCGAIPVVSDQVKVFREKDYCLLVDGDPTTKEFQQHAAMTIVSLLQDNNKAEEARQMVTDAVFNRMETWDSIAEEWVKLFES